MTREERFCERLGRYVEKIVEATEKHHGLEPGSLSARYLDGALWSWVESVELALEREREQEEVVPALEQALGELLGPEPQSQSWFVAKTKERQGAVAMTLQKLIDKGQAEWVTGVGYKAASA